ncbi:acyltransferase family protein [Hymenobacter negativus]|uniref:Acyltransferase n=1 Tax=Hymenobacter negativus TaxID=2795026 RepID=A0ABS3Q959_9BACT|nr:acyltransferase [Hymenobacter negativus]MBO2007783.1 acyltransferase [Hymenobacter negativus]
MTLPRSQPTVAPPSIDLRQHNEKIDVLRGVAILLVFSGHSLIAIFGDYDFIDFSPSGLWIDFSRFAPGRVVLTMTPWAMGAHGVTLFLVISGFLIHWGFLKSGAAFRLSEFFNKRFWRIYPPYLVALAVFGLSLGTGGAFSLLTHLTLTHNLFERSYTTINPSFWSLGLEMQFYLLYPVLLLLRRWLGIGQATLAVAGCAVLTLALLLIFGVRSSTPWISPPALWLNWVIGAWLGERFFLGQRVFKRGPGYLVGFYVLLTLSKLTLIYLVLGRLLFSLFFVCLMDWYLHQKAPVTSALGRGLKRLTARVGLYSYSIYLFHHPFLYRVITFFSFGQQNKLVLGLAVVLAFGLMFGIAHFTYHWLELPAIRWGKALYARWRPPVRVGIPPLTT